MILNFSNLKNFVITTREIFKKTKYYFENNYF